MKSLDMLKQVDHGRKAAIYAAEHDGKLRNFAYTEELGECRETFSRLLHDVQEGEIGVILTPDAASLAIETSPAWMDAFIRAVKQHGVLIGDHGHDLAYDLREGEDEALFRALFSPEDYVRERLAPRPLADAIVQSPFVAASIEYGENWFLVTRLVGEGTDTAIYVLSSGALGQDVDLFGMGRWKEILDLLAPYGISHEEGWLPVPPRTQGLALPHTAARGRHGRASRCRDGAAPGFPAPGCARERDPATERAGARQQEKTETGRKKPMREPPDFTHEEYQLTG